MTRKPGIRAPAIADAMNPGVGIVVVVASVIATVATARQSLGFEESGEVSVRDRQSVDLEPGEIDAMRRAFVFPAVVAPHGECARRHLDHPGRLRQ